MTKIQKLTILLLFMFSSSFACTCRFEGYSFSFFKNIKYSFIGTVVKIDSKNFKNIFTFKVNKVYKGKIDTVIQVQSGSGGGDCGVYFELNKTFLVELEYKDKLFQTSRCLFNAQNGTPEFIEDTMLLNLFAKKNVFVDLTNMRGQIKDGKQTGYWKEAGESGNYVNGKRNGIWRQSSGSEIHYKNGKILKSIDYLLNEKRTDSAKVMMSNRTSILYYTNGKIHKILTPKKLLIYYPNGTLKEKMKLTKRHYIYGYWYKYDEKGKMIQKKYVENDYSEDAYWYFDCVDVF